MCICSSKTPVAKNMYIEVIFDHQLMQRALTSMCPQNPHHFSLQKYEVRVKIRLDKIRYISDIQSSWTKYTNIQSRQYAYHWSNIALSSCLTVAPYPWHIWWHVKIQVYLQKYFIFLCIGDVWFIWFYHHKQEWDQNWQQTRESKVCNVILP